jgi:hypothetical protein
VKGLRGFLGACKLLQDHLPKLKSSEAHARLSIRPHEADRFCWTAAAEQALKQQEIVMLTARTLCTGFAMIRCIHTDAFDYGIGAYHQRDEWQTMASTLPEPVFSDVQTQVGQQLRKNVMQFFTAPANSLNTCYETDHIRVLCTDHRNSSFFF